TLSIRRMSSVVRVSPLPPGTVTTCRSLRATPLRSLAQHLRVSAATTRSDQARYPLSASSAN
ncbi:MAG: hypothetical protein KC585_03085, partial [Candidatus Magasanikbacteria bacterium]|nr:hypothetical protein [Candidatus Magasanikbacteria bacterium]